jgi:hypothetical protein
MLLISLVGSVEGGLDGLNDLVLELVAEIHQGLGWRRELIGFKCRRHLT